VYRYCFAAILLLLGMKHALAREADPQVVSAFVQPLGLEGRHLTLRCSVSWVGEPIAYQLQPPRFDSLDGLDIQNISLMTKTEITGESGRHRFSEIFLLRMTPQRSGLVRTGPGDIAYLSLDGSSGGVLPVPSAGIRVLAWSSVLLIALAVLSPLTASLLFAGRRTHRRRLARGAGLASVTSQQRD